MKYLVSSSSINVIKRQDLK